MAQKVFTRDDDISYLEIHDIETGEVTIVKKYDYLIEAPNWTQDGKYLVYNSRGKIYKYDLETGEDVEIYTDYAQKCNNDHVLSPDGTEIAISHSAEPNSSRVYIVPFEGGVPRLITPLSRSYLHGWSPDGTTLAYCSYREDGKSLSTMSVKGGEEKVIVDTEFFSDGPEYSPDGKHIWFNTMRSGHMQAWRIEVDGSNLTQMTFDEDKYVWFPHISPDGEKVVTLAFNKGDVEPINGHPPHKNIDLRLMSADGSDLKVVRSFFGGQGTINVNSWSPCSKKFAYVRYELPTE